MQSKCFALFSFLLFFLLYFAILQGNGTNSDPAIGKENEV